MSDQLPGTGAENTGTPHDIPQETTPEVATEIGLPTEDDRSPWHPTHIPHLVMGLALIGLVTVWAIVVPLNLVELPDARWLLPLPWLVAGAAGLAATVLSGRRRG